MGLITIALLVGVLVLLLRLVPRAAVAGQTRGGSDGTGLRGPQPAGAGTVRVYHRDRKLKDRNEYVFHLGREEFDDDVTCSPSGRYVTGVSQGNFESGGDPTRDVALVDTTTGVAPFVLRFRDRPRWPRVSDAGLLIVREVGAEEATILHAFDSDGRRRWAVTLPTSHDLTEFSADGRLIAIVSGLFWRTSNADVRTWLLQPDSGRALAQFSGTESLRGTDDGHCEITGPSGPVKFLSPPGMLDRVLATDYLETWRSRLGEGRVPSSGRCERGPRQG